MNRLTLPLPSRACLILFAALGVTSLHAAAQQTPAPLLTAGSFSGGTMGASLSLSQFDKTTGIQTDVILGRDTPGPYLLSWKNAETNTETVLRNGLLQHAPADYTLDSASGSIAFTTPLHSGDMVRITYLCNSPDLAPNDAGTTFPLAWDVVQGKSSRLRIRTLVSTVPTPESDRTKPAKVATNALQWTGSQRLFAGTQLETGLYADLHGGNWLERSGLTLGEKTHTTLTDLTLGYTRAGSQFTQQDESKLTAGREILSVSDLLRPLRNVTFSASYTQTTGLPDTLVTPGAKGDTTRELATGAAYALPANGGKIEVGRTETTTVPAQGATSVTERDTLNAQATLQKTTQVGVGYEAAHTQSFTTTTPANGATDGTFTQSSTLTVKHQPNAQYTFSGSFQNTLDKTNGGDTQTLRVEASPFRQWKQLRFTGGLEDRYTDTGATRTREGTLDLPAFADGRVKLSGGYRQTVTGRQAQNVGLLDARVRPLRYVDINGSVRFRDALSADGTPDTAHDQDTYDIKLGLSTNKRLQFTSRYALNPEDGSSYRRIEKRSLGLESDWGLLALRGQWGLETTLDTPTINNAAELGLDLRLTRWDVVSTGYKASSLWDKSASGSTSYLLGYTRRLGSVFDLSLNGLWTHYNTDGRIDPAKTEIKGEAKLGVHF